MKLFIIIISVFAINSVTFADDPLQDKVNQLDMHSKKLLGVSIFAASESIRMKGSPVFAPLEYVESSGDLEHLKELESQGYIEIKYKKGLPDGTMKDQDYLWYIRTDEGEQLQRCFEIAQHNNPLNVDAQNSRAP